MAELFGSMIGNGRLSSRCSCIWAASHAWMIVGLSAEFCIGFERAYAGGRFRTYTAPHDGVQSV
jgi:hypothetical protein